MELTKKEILYIVDEVIENSTLSGNTKNKVGKFVSDNVFNVPFSEMTFIITTHNLGSCFPDMAVYPNTKVVLIWSQQDPNLVYDVFTLKTYNENVNKISGEVQLLNLIARKLKLAYL